MSRYFSKGDGSCFGYREKGPVCLKARSLWKIFTGVISDRINLCFQLFWFFGAVFGHVRIFLRCFLQLFGEIHVLLSQGY